MNKQSDLGELLNNALPEGGINVADPKLWKNEDVLPIFEKLRREDPVHLAKNTPYGDYWSITRYDDIKYVDTANEIFSSAAELGGIVIADEIFNADSDFQIVNFIGMDNPRHQDQRLAVQKIAASPSLKSFEDLIRERTCMVLDDLPVGEEFDWVEHVSIKLTTMMLATLFDFPFEDRAKLTRWSDVATAEEGSPLVESQEQRIAELVDCLNYFTELWNQRVNEPPRTDLVSMLAHSPATRNATPLEYLGNLLLLIVGGNDTTRNTMSATIRCMNMFPEEAEKVRNDPSLIDAMVAEVIRWQTPLSHMRRTALVDTELGGKQIKKGDKVVMWYYSGNHEAETFPDPDQIKIGRENVRNHLSFGFGIHRCMGLRLAEQQLRILWQELLKRWDRIEMIGEPEIVESNFVNGYSKMMVRIPG